MSVILQLKKKDEHAISCNQNWGRFLRGFIGVSDGKESAWNAGVPGLIPGSGRSPGEGIGYPLQYTCLEYTLPSILSWTEEPDGIQSIGLQRIGDNWAANTFKGRFS